MASETKLIGREVVATDTMAFHFEKPPGFRFEAGQAIDVILPGSPGSSAQGLRHTFSIVSAPFEDEIVIATRMRDSAFKQTLKSLPDGSAVNLDGPFGSLTLRGDRTRAAVLIAGGIGITPFMSIVRQAAHEQSPQALTLVYSNRRPEDAAFLSELQQLAERNAHFRLVATMTRPGQSSQRWNGRTGQIDDELIRQIRGDGAAPVYYVAGPPEMVEAMWEILHDADVRDDDICGEEFYGY